MILNRFKSLLATLTRSLVAIAVATLLLVSSTVPAFAMDSAVHKSNMKSGNPQTMINSTRSSPTEGEAPLNEIYEKSEDALKQPPLSMEKVQQEATKGYNEVQGDADFDKMHRPDNSQEATSAAEKVENALEKVFNR